MRQSTYIVFAGVNGAGKSTFFHTRQWDTEGLFCDMPRVNSDEILVAQGGDGDSSADQLHAGKDAVRQINKLLSGRVSFNQETTLTGHYALRTIKRARELGYKVILYYIGVDSPVVASSRINHRVSLGGHFIDEATVATRYKNSLRNLSLALDYCDEVVIYDNTIDFIAVARWTQGVLSWVGPIAKHASWLLKAIENEDIWR